MNLFRSIPRVNRRNGRNHHQQQRQRQNFSAPTTRREYTQEEKLERKRQERKLWFTYSLKPYVTVLRSNHFIKATTLQEEKKETATRNDEDLLICHPVGAAPVVVCEDEVVPKTMKLWNIHDGEYHEVEAECAICLVEYKEGDQIIQSSANGEDSEGESCCHHVYHADCMMQWIARGHKRCPFCRQWFVRPAPIKQQMEEAHVVTRASMCHLYDQKTMKGLVSLNEDLVATSSASDDLMRARLGLVFGSEVSI